MRRGLVAAVGLLLSASLLGAHGQKPWPVPAEAKKRRNPVAATPESIQKGAKLYQTHCLICHGENGDGQGPWAEKLPVPAGNFTDRRLMSEMTDGEIFWKISQGREEMPRFEHQLNERQRWHLVNYLRTLAQGKPRGAGSR